MIGKGTHERFIVDAESSRIKRMESLINNGGDRRKNNQGKNDSKRNNLKKECHGF